jgi:hypothetical protein
MHMANLAALSMHIGELGCSCVRYTAIQKENAKHVC